MILPQDVTEAAGKVVGRRGLMVFEMADWWSGPADGGPNGNGMYPATDASGFTQWNPSPARVLQMGGAGGGASSMDLAARGIKLAAEAGQVAALGPIVVEMLSKPRKMLTGSGDLLVDRHLDLSGISVDLMNVRMIAAGGMGARLGIITGASATMPRAAVEIGGKPTAGNNEWASKRLFFDGNRSQQVTPFPAVSMTGDQGGMNDYTIAVVNHLGDGLVIRGDCEKKRIFAPMNNISGSIVRIAADVTTPTASPDELNLFPQGNNVGHAYISEAGLQTSTTVTFNVEQCRPPAGRAAIEVGGGKVESFGGEVRGVTGRGIMIHRGGTGSGSGGADVVLRGLVGVQFYGDHAMWAVNPKNMAGDAYFRILEPGADKAAIILQSCHRSYSAHLHMDRVKARAGVQIGYAASPLGEIKAMVGHYIPLSISMGDDNMPAHGMDAVHVDMAIGCTIDTRTRLQGNIRVDQGASNCTHLVKADWVRDGYTATVHPLATYELRITTPIASTDLFDKPWLFPGVLASSVSDLGGMPHRYDGTAWVSVAPMNTSHVALAGSASLLNQRLKRRGAIAFDTDTALVYVAQGAAPTDPWRAGNVLVQPGYTSMLADYEARVTAAGGAAFTPAWRDAVDRALIDLVDRGLWTPGAIATSKVKTLAILCQADLAAGLVNPLFDDLSPTAAGTLHFVPWQGVKGDGLSGHLNFGWNMATTPRGVTLDNLHLGSMSEEDSDDATYDIGGHLTSWAVRSHRADGGSTVRMGVSVGTTLGHAPMPRHVIGVRAAGGSYGFSSGGIPAVYDPDPATVPIPTAIYGLRAQTTYSAQRASILHAGGALSPADAASLLAIIGQLRRAAARIAG